VGTWALLKDSVKLSLDAVPENVDPVQVKAYFEKLEGVREVHDLHIWGMSTTENALTVHLVMPQNLQGDHFLEKISKDLKTKFNIHHPTIQIETGADGVSCELKSSDVV
jgi:cobalt-zinc-cadmium efflux system protein